MKPINLTYQVLMCFFAFIFYHSHLNAQQVSSSGDTCVTGNCKDGAGTLHYSNGNKYIGLFKNGVPNGQGSMFYANGNRYQGNFENNLKSGEGKMFFSSGNIYTGSFTANRMEGKGILELANGDKFTGDFINGQF